MHPVQQLPSLVPLSWFFAVLSPPSVLGKAVLWTIRCRHVTPHREYLQIPRTLFLAQQITLPLIGLGLSSDSYPCSSCLPPASRVPGVRQRDVTAKNTGEIRVDTPSPVSVPGQLSGFLVPLSCTFLAGRLALLTL
jgi:hypothetical protein